MKKVVASARTRLGITPSQKTRSQKPKSRRNASARGAHPIEQTSSGDTVHEGYKRAKALHRAPGENDEDIFRDWKNPKPRHTHTAEMIRPDGMLWNCRVAPLRSMPKRRREDEPNIIARFVFNYTSPEKIEMYTSAPCNSNATSSESSSAPKRPRLSVVPEPRRTKTVTPPIKTEEELQKQAKADKIRAKIALGYHQLRELGVIVEGDETKPIIVD